MRSDRERDIKPAPAVTTPEGRPVWYPDTAILTTEEVAAVLGVDIRTVQRWKIRRCYASGNTVRYLYRDVVQYLADRAA